MNLSREQLVIIPQNPFLFRDHLHIMMLPSLIFVGFILGSFFSSKQLYFISYTQKMFGCFQ
jgi:uncharacterized protein YneF (UPF0154 family)